jgi:hypothetical protein
MDPRCKNPVNLSIQGILELSIRDPEILPMHVTRNMFYCFSCHESGDSITFVMKVNRMTFSAAVQWLQTKA